MHCYAEIFCHLCTMIGKLCYQIFKAVGQTQAELYSLTFEKLDACVRLLFVNLVTCGAVTLGTVH